MCFHFLCTGFTGLAERLCACGSEGMEQLVVVINDYFSRLIRIVTEDCDGDVLYFVGDALVVFFSRADSDQKKTADLTEAYLKSLDPASIQTVLQACFGDPVAPTLPSLRRKSVSAPLINNLSVATLLENHPDLASLRASLCAAKLMRDADSYVAGDVTLLIHIGLLDFIVASLQLNSQVDFIYIRCRIGNGRTHMHPCRWNRKPMEICLHWLCVRRALCFNVML